MQPASISGESQGRTLLQVSPMQPLSEPVASMTQAAHTNPRALCTAPNLKPGQANTPDTAQQRQVTAASAFAELTNRPNKLLSPDSPQHEAPQSKASSQSNAAVHSLKVPTLSRQKAFKAPAMQMQPQSMTPSKAQQSRTSPDQAKHMGSRTGLVFPGPYAGPLQRHVAVPTSFTSLPAYKQTWSVAVTEELNIRWTFFTNFKHLTHAHLLQKRKSMRRHDAEMICARMHECSVGCEH